MSKSAHLNVTSGICGSNYFCYPKFFLSRWKFFKLLFSLFEKLKLPWIQPVQSFFTNLIDRHNNLDLDQNRAGSLHLYHMLFLLWEELILAITRHLLQGIHPCCTGFLPCPRYFQDLNSQVDFLLWITLLSSV